MQSRRRRFSVEGTRKVGVLLPIVVWICSLALFPFREGEAQSNIIAQSDFEDGTLQGWIPRGSGVVLTNTTEAAHGGARSLKTTGRSATWHGPSLDLTGKLLKGATYQITAAVRLVSGQPASTLKITMQRSPVGDTTKFDQIASSATGGVTDSAWVTLQGQYSFATDVTGLLLYVESPDNATVQFYLDDVSVVMVAPPPGGPRDDSGVRGGFETGTAEGWMPRGSVTLTVTTADQHSGSYSLLTSNRTAAWQGPRLNVTSKMYNGSRYRISVWVKLAPGSPPTNMRVSLERTLAGTTTFHTVVPNTQVTADQWKQLSATYDYTFNHDSLYLYVESASGTPSFYIDDYDVSYVPPPEPELNIPSVYQTLSDYFPVGAAIWQGNITGPHSVLLTKHFNSITAENDMKWDALEPTEGNFNFATADALVNFAMANNMLVRGHTLVWHNQNPSWLFKDANGNDMQPTPENKALLLQRLENHIRAVVGHFRGKVYAWDVVNEVIDPSQPDGFRRSKWYEITGPDYIERAFRVAHEADPNAKLYINDYNTTDPVKRAFLYNLVRDLKQRGVPIDGVGHQMHSNIAWPSTADVIATINLFAGLGLDNQITELDVSVYTDSTTSYASPPQDVLIKQGYQYRDLFRAFRYLKDEISSVTLWGLADDHTWLSTPTRLNWPLLFNEQLKAKPAYWGVVDPSQLPGSGSMASTTGAYFIGPGGRRAMAAFSLSNNGPAGTFAFNYRDDLSVVQFKSTDVISYAISPYAQGAISGYRVTFTVVGALNKQPGYILVGSAIDAGPVGSRRDALSLSIYTPTGDLIFSSGGPIEGGDIAINP